MQNKKLKSRTQRAGFLLFIVGVLMTTNGLLTMSFGDVMGGIPVWTAYFGGTAAFVVCGFLLMRGSK